MPLPKLSPLQSRLAASLAGSLTLLLLYLALTSPHLAYALEIDSTFSEDHNHERLQPFLFDQDYEILDGQENGYEAEFFGVNRGIIGRQVPLTVDLENNTPRQDNIPMGESKLYRFTNASVFGPLTPAGVGLPSAFQARASFLKSQDALEETDNVIAERQTASKHVYITVNTCLQPQPNDPNSLSGPPEQLTMYVSTSDSNQDPGPTTTAGQTNTTLTGGYGALNVSAAGNIYISVYAPNSTAFNNVYNIEIAVSIDGPYHSYFRSEPNLYLVDTDSTSALFVTNNLTDTTNGTIFDKWMTMSPPFVMFIANQNNTAAEGLRNSYCGLIHAANVPNTIGNPTDMTMTNVTLGPNPKEQLYLQGLNASSSYYGMLAMVGNSTNSGAGVVGGGGSVWQTMTFQTQSDKNCAVLNNLPFCTTVAYAAPGNPNSTFSNTTALGIWYDDMVQAQYQLFQNVLDQIPCEITSSGQYSLAKTCDDCAAAYKIWLCSVMIPRCMDYSSKLPWLQERNLIQPFPDGTSLDPAIIAAARPVMFLNSSRNPIIDANVSSGPYKEILPCDDLCYNLVRSCPASMGFSCPQPGSLGFDHSYGLRPDGSAAQQGQITCNYPGAAYDLSDAGRGVVPFGMAVLVAGLLAMTLTLSVF